MRKRRPFGPLTILTEPPSGPILISSTDLNPTLNCARIEFLSLKKNGMRLRLQSTSSKNCKGRIKREETTQPRRNYNLMRMTSIPIEVSVYLIKR
jgi:hypothetical protein